MRITGADTCGLLLTGAQGALVNGAGAPQAGHGPGKRSQEHRWEGADTLRRTLSKMDFGGATGRGKQPWGRTRSRPAGQKAGSTTTREAWPSPAQAWTGIPAHRLGQGELLSWGPSPGPAISLSSAASAPAPGTAQLALTGLVHLLSPRPGLSTACALFCFRNNITK